MRKRFAWLCVCVFVCVIEVENAFCLISCVINVALEAD